jgi:hypothetical protein
MLTDSVKRHDERHHRLVQRDAWHQHLQENDSGTAASKLLLNMTILTTSLNMHRWAAINGRTDSIIEYVMLCAVTGHCKLYCRYSSTGESTSSTGVLAAALVGCAGDYHNDIIN